jgi:hypothetical protein
MPAGASSRERYSSIRKRPRNRPEPMRGGACHDLWSCESGAIRACRSTPCDGAARVVVCPRGHNFGMKTWVGLDQAVAVREYALTRIALETICRRSPNAGRSQSEARRRRRSATGGPPTPDDFRWGPADAGRRPPGARRRRATTAGLAILGQEPCEDQARVTKSCSSIVPWSAIDTMANELGLEMP